MTINEACNLLKEELLDNGYEYGFCLNGITYKPDFTKGFDNMFFERLLKEYAFKPQKIQSRQRLERATMRSY